MNAGENRNVFSLDLNVPSKLLSVTVLGGEFYVAGAEQRNACLANAVLASGSDIRVVVVVHRVRTLSHSLMYCGDVLMYSAVVRLLSTVNCFVIFVFLSYVLALLINNMLV